MARVFEPFDDRDPFRDVEFFPFVELRLAGLAVRLLAVAERPVLAAGRVDPFALRDDDRAVDLAGDDLAGDDLAGDDLDADDLDDDDRVGVDFDVDDFDADDLVGEDLDAEVLDGDVLAGDRPLPLREPWSSSPPFALGRLRTSLTISAATVAVPMRVPTPSTMPGR